MLYKQLLCDVNNYYGDTVAATHRLSLMDSVRNEKCTKFSGISVQTELVLDSMAFYTPQLYWLFYICFAKFASQLDNYHKCRENLM